MLVIMSSQCLYRAYTADTFLISGLFNIKQLPRLNSLVCHMPDSLDLAFKLRRKKFTIEVTHCDVP